MCRMRLTNVCLKTCKNVSMRAHIVTYMCHNVTTLKIVVHNISRGCQYVKYIYVHSQLFTFIIIIVIIIISVFIFICMYMCMYI